MSNGRKGAANAPKNEDWSLRKAVIGGPEWGKEVHSVFRKIPARSVDTCLFGPSLRKKRRNWGWGGAQEVMIEGEKEAG